MRTEAPWNVLKLCELLLGQNIYIFTVHVMHINTCGDIRIKMSYVNLEKLGDISILAKQVGDGFDEYKLDTGAYAFNVYQTKISNKEELAKALEQDSKNMAGGMIFIIIVLIIIGIILFRTNIKNLIDKIKNKTSK